jgi:hypothetical protein
MSFYKYITEKESRKDTPELKRVMESVVSDLNKYHTDDLKPGILLGLIQSGKTRAFVGVIAKSFDEGYDIAVVLTKNSVALVDQTIKRLKSEFEMPIERNKLFVWDVIKIQEYDHLTGYILSNKIIFVVKKETKNMEKLLDIFKLEQLQTKKVLIIDDEADQASVSFVSDKQKEDGIDFAKIATQISNFRLLLKGKNSFLQVTATPYSLYLQPESVNFNQEEYAPIRPAFTHLLKPHEAYVGGKYYFEESLDGHSPASHIHIQVTDEELDFLNGKSKTTQTYNKKVIDNILLSKNIEKIRFALFNFLVGGAIRQLQENNDDFWSKPYHCAFVLHTSTTKQIHRQQKQLVTDLIKSLKEVDAEKLKELLRPSYHNLVFSLNASGKTFATFDKIIEAIENALIHNHIGIIEVNSENQVSELLGQDGQLRLDNPFNIFVGGQSLDRGITIDHLIGFFYGRNPNTFQMDTVLQHSRMYGSRTTEDLAVTRFYTSARVYNSMRNMHGFDNDLRENIENDIHTATARFIAKQGNSIIPAGPNKLKASGLISFKSYSRLLPIGFQTKSYTDIKSSIEKIDNIIANFKTNTIFKIKQEIAVEIIRLIRSTYTYETRFRNKGLEWDIDPFLKALEIALEKNNTNDVSIYYQENRSASRMKNQESSFGDAPDDGRTDLPISKKTAENGPVLMLLKQNGKESEGWRNAPFYWPVLVMPKNMPNYVYCRD